MINRIILETKDNEDEKTMALFKMSESIIENGFLNKAELIKVLKWKSPRPLRFYNQNEESDIVRITKLALSQNDDVLSIHILSALKGVNYPSASAILMFCNPDRFPVLDIRVWKQLYRSNLVNENPRGMNFTLDQWRKYLKVIRGLSVQYNLTAHQIEKRISNFDKLHQKGALYK